MAVYATTELEAVNIMLAAIGESPVATLAEDTIEDAMIALTTLQQVSKDFQSEGWHFNTDYDYELSVDGNSKIPVPVTAAHVDSMNTTGKDIVRRGGFMWDRENKTFTFSDLTSLKCKIVWMYDFEDLPQAARSYVAYKAARKFVQDVMGDEASVQYTANEEQMARARFLADEARRADLNMLSSSYTVNRAVRRRSPWPV